MVPKPHSPLISGRGARRERKVAGKVAGKAWSPGSEPVWTRWPHGPANGSQCFPPKHQVSSPALHSIAAPHGPLAPGPLVALSPECAQQRLLSSLQGVRRPSQRPAPHHVLQERGRDQAASPGVSPLLPGGAINLRGAINQGKALFSLYTLPMVLL